VQQSSILSATRSKQLTREKESQLHSNQLNQPVPSLLATAVADVAPTSSLAAAADEDNPAVYMMMQQQQRLLLPQAQQELPPIWGPPFHQQDSGCCTTSPVATCTSNSAQEGRRALQELDRGLHVEHLKGLEQVILST
jgi:hypothetical protein